jgi:hypothetical protein
MVAGTKGPKFLFKPRSDKTHSSWQKACRLGHPFPYQRLSGLLKMSGINPGKQILFRLHVRMTHSRQSLR